MIKTIRHKTLNNYWTKGQARGLDVNWIPRLRRILLALDNASRPEDLNVPGWRFHSLSGSRMGTYSVKLTGNWRLTFQWDGKDIVDVDIEDYH